MMRFRLAPHLKLALYAEWAKLRTAPGTIWLLIGVVVSTVAISLTTVAASGCHTAGCVADPAKTSLTGVYLGQAVVAVLAALAIGEEYGTGMIRVSLTAMPRRVTMLSAKALVLTGPVSVASAISVAASMLAGWLVLPGHVFGPGEWDASFRTSMYLTLIAALSLGVTTVIRESAAAIGVVLGILYLFPVAASLFRDPAVARHLEQVGPLSAGLDAQASTGLGHLPLTPWQGLAVVALWAAGALIAGGAVLRLRDA